MKFTKQEIEYIERLTKIHYNHLKERIETIGQYDIFTSDFMIAEGLIMKLNLLKNENKTKSE